MRLRFKKKIEDLSFQSVKVCTSVSNDTVIKFVLYIQLFKGEIILKWFLVSQFWCFTYHSDVATPRACECNVHFDDKNSHKGQQLCYPSFTPILSLTVHDLFTFWPIQIIQLKEAVFITMIFWKWNLGLPTQWDWQPLPPVEILHSVTL